MKINEVENMTEATFPVTLDVKSLYTNIPNHEGNEATKEALKSVPIKPIAAEFLILTMKNFFCNGIHYL